MTGRLAGPLSLLSLLTTSNLSSPFLSFPSLLFLPFPSLSFPFLSFFPSFPFCFLLPFLLVKMTIVCGFLVYLTQRMPAKHKFSLLSIFHTFLSSFFLSFASSLSYSSLLFSLFSITVLSVCILFI